MIAIRNLSASLDFLSHVYFLWKNINWSGGFLQTTKQQGAGSTIQSNHIEHVSHLFSRNKWAITLQNCAQFHMWQFRQDLFGSWGKNPPESDFLRNRGGPIKDFFIIASILPSMIIICKLLHRHKFNRDSDNDNLNFSATPR